MTMNDHWGYNKNDQNFKTTEDLIRKLCDIASKGGNFLLNVGPTAEGLIPPTSVERLREIGKWMAVNGDSIHGSTASPLPALPWGRVTMKRDGAQTILYLHVFDWPTDGRVGIARNRQRAAASAAPRGAEHAARGRGGSSPICGSRFPRICPIRSARSWSSR